MKKTASRRPGPPMLRAMADETAPSKTVTAENVARMTDTTFFNRRSGMPSSFLGQDADPS